MRMHVRPDGPKLTASRVGRKVCLAVVLCTGPSIAGISVESGFPDDWNVHGLRSSSPGIPSGESRSALEEM